MQSLRRCKDKVRHWENEKKGFTGTVASEIDFENRKDSSRNRKKKKEHFKKARNRIHAENTHVCLMYSL